MAAYSTEECAPLTVTTALVVNDDEPLTEEPSALNFT